MVNSMSNCSNHPGRETHLYHSAKTLGKAPARFRCSSFSLSIKKWSGVGTSKCCGDVVQKDMELAIWCRTFEHGVIRVGRPSHQLQVTLQDQRSSALVHLQVPGFKHHHGVCWCAVEIRFRAFRISITVSKIHLRNLSSSMRV